MPSANALRTQIEAVLKDKISAALSPAQRATQLAAPTGIAGLDHLLEGGLPLAAITEMVGSSCSGRMTAGLAYLSSLTQAGKVCAWIDVDDELDPESAAANGVELERLLWVRCGQAQRMSSRAHNESQNIGRTGNGSPPSSHSAGGGSPRSEVRDRLKANPAVLDARGGLQDGQVRREKMVGTPSAPNRPFSRWSEQREEQPNSDRLPARRGDNLALAPKCAEPQARRIASLTGESRPEPLSRALGDPPTSRKPLRALDHALRATDLLLQAGGFGAIVLDLGGLPPEIAWRIPLATWFRFRAACERSRISLLLLTQHPCSRSSAELVVRLETGTMDAESKVMAGVRYRATVERSRTQEPGTQEPGARVVPIRKPPESAPPGQWKSEAAWAQSK